MLAHFLMGIWKCVLYIYRTEIGYLNLKGSLIFMEDTVLFFSFINFLDLVG